MPPRRRAAWAHAWNARDIEAVLAHFRDDVTFHSPVASQVVGTPTLRGKEALRQYWAAALARIRRLQFTVDRALWDTERRELAIFYVAELDDRRTRACECWLRALTDLHMRAWATEFDAR